MLVLQLTNSSKSNRIYSEREVAKLYRASVGITTSMELSATNWIAHNADSLGVEGIWVGEDIGLGQETSILTASL
ncbi:MAG: hypothetical protein BV458_14115, partial [Thermoplasmata archaeon M9B2D]